MSNYRVEKDTLGEIKVPEDKYWGAQTQRSYNNFKIGNEKMPIELIKSFAMLKKACAIANFRLSKLSKDNMDLLCMVCDEVMSGDLNDNFPLSVWQTGSGTQTNMNVNEVIANRGNYIKNEKLLHPNDTVNMSQSSNDTFPSAMKISSVCEIEDKLLPSLDNLILVFDRLQEKNEDIIKVGRTHLQDAVPLSFAQEISGWKTMLIKNKEMIKKSLKSLRELPIGATAVGTGLNAPKGFDKEVTKVLSELLNKEFIPAENKFHALTSMDAFVFAHGSLKALASNLMKIANDIRWLSSGPRCGLGEIEIPANEPGSSIMPGKVNPTQCEAVTMVSVQVISNDVAIGFAASQGNFELNVFMPVCIYNFLQSVKLLSDAMQSFANNCVYGIKPNKQKMSENLNRSLMLATALNSYIGYDNAAKVSKKAFNENISLKEAAIELGFLTEQTAEEILDPKKMI